MPSVGWGENDVVPVHWAMLAVDDGIGLASVLKYEAQRVWRMPMRARRLAGQQKLKRRLHGARGLRPKRPAESRIAHQQHTPLRVCRRGGGCRLVKDLLQLRPAPNARVLRFGLVGLMSVFPEREQIVRSGSLFEAGRWRHAGDINHRLPFRNGERLYETGIMCQ